MRGQGQSGKSIHTIHAVDIESCKSRCSEYDGCIAIDFTSKDQKDACRLYGKNNARSNPGRDNRQYCNVGKGWGKF